MKTLLWLVCVSSLLVSPVFAENQKVRLFLFTAPPASGLVDYESKRRTDSLQDLRASLKYRKNLALAASEAEADALVEIIGSDQVATGGTSSSVVRVPATSVFLGSSTPDYRNTVRVRLSVPRLNYSTEMVSTSGGLWTAVASDVAGQLATWAKDNAAQLRGH